jgi:hypothetical protein
MRRLYLIPLLVLLSGHVRSEEVRTLVLAAGTNSTIPPLTVQEARKLFLGIPVERNGATVTPILNTSDPLLYEVFLQKVTYMSSPAYETQLVSTVFRMGGKRPRNFADAKTLVEALRKDPNSVTYLWQDQIQKLQGVKAVNVLWTGSTE